MLTGEYQVYYMPLSTLFLSVVGWKSYGIVGNFLVMLLPAFQISELFLNSKFKHRKCKIIVMQSKGSFGGGAQRSAWGSLGGRSNVNTPSQPQPQYKKVELAKIDIPGTHLSLVIY